MKKGRACARPLVPEPEGGKGSGSVEHVLGGEIVVTEVMGDSLTGNVPATNVEPVGQVMIALQRLDPAKVGE